MNDSFHLDADFETYGVFWRASSPDRKFPGTVSSKQGVVELRGAPEYAHIDDDSMRRMFSTLNSPPNLEGSPAICGFTTLNRCTLLDPVRLGGDGLAHFPSREMIDRTRYRAMRTVLGLHLDSADALLLRGGAFYLSKTQHLFPQPWTSTMSNEHTQHTVSHTCLEPFHFKCKYLDAAIECEVFANGGQSRGKGVRIKSVPRIKITPNNLQSVNWFAGLGFRLENFFSLILGSSIGLQRIQLFHDKEVGWLIQKVNKRNEKVDLQAMVRCSHAELADALDKWLSIPESDRMAELRLLGILRKSEMFPETEFLTLAQVLEGFGRIRFGGFKRREAKFKDLIKSTYRLLPPKTAEMIVGDLESFSNRLIQTRDFHTHLGNQEGGLVARSLKDLFLLNKRLHALIRAAILIDLGIPEPGVSEAAIYQANRWR